MTAPASRIVIIGLGPGDADSRTVGAQKALDAADRIIVRTRIHPGLADLASDRRVTDCDDLYERADAFESLYPAIARRVLDAAGSGGTVVFAVPGHPRFGERCVPLIEAEARTMGIPVDVLDAVSFVDATAAALRFDPLTLGLQVVDAEQIAATLDADPFAAGQLRVDPTRPVLVAQVYNHGLAAAVKIALSRLYPDEHPVVLIQAAGISSEQSVRTTSLHTLDRQEVDHLTSLWSPALASLDAVRSSESLNQVVARLRAPGGCPWDREQSHASLRNAVLAEAYEVVDAIDSEDDDGLTEELGDLLLLITMHAQIAEERGTFRIEDVYEGINRKLVRRHPHVFGSATAQTASDVVSTWEGVKETERAATGDARTEQSRFDRLPRAMPATRKAIEILAPRASLAAPEDPDAGSLLLAAVSALIARGLDPDRALEASLRKAVAQQDDDKGAFASASAGSKLGRALA